MAILRLILGDQLHYGHSWFQHVDSQVTYLLIEARSETDYVHHHIQKVAAFFSAMRQFAAHIQKQGHQVQYIHLDDDHNKGSIEENLLAILQGFDRLEYQLPDEWRLDQILTGLAQKIGISVGIADTEHFLTKREDLAQFFSGKKTYLMESFYRHMRVRYQVLMQASGEPEGAQWNYDHDNRHKWTGHPAVPTMPSIQNNVSEIVDMIHHQGVSCLGEIEPKALAWPLNRAQALVLLEHFTQHLLPHFGTYQDAMHTSDAYLFHSRLSFALNIKLLHPLEVVRAVEAAYHAQKQSISLAQAEGFIRQIIGWREYMRGVYWAKMPGYAQLNYFHHSNPLPSWYWTAETKMNCLHHAIKGSLQQAYAHHIQRLMVTGNFALLAGINPTEVDAWYLGIYIDAIEWVEITNTRGMSQYADGGIVGSKPYVSSANYIDKMSNYCGSCYYLKKEKLGDRACPFNSLYWHFYNRNRALLERNPRIGMMYRTWDKMSDEQKEAILSQANKLLQQLEQL
jgi:deoxyribodipyrimidine photolyase-related protein